MKTATRKRTLRLIAAVVCGALLPGCSVTDALYTAGGSAAGAAAGAFIGSKASNNPAAPVVGAAGGAAVGGIGTMLAINSAKAGQRKQFQAGYDQGASDTVKRQYWILQNLQKGKQEPAYRLTHYRFTIPPEQNDPVKTVPRDITIPIYE
jgi:phage tail tape-measure protein